MKKIAVLAVLGALIAAPASAQFKVEQARTASQQVELELTNSIRVGNVLSGTQRSAHRAKVNYGAFESLTLGFGIEVENRSQADSNVTGLIWSSNLQLLGSPLGEPRSAYALSLYSEFSMETANQQRVDFLVGPVVEADAGGASSTINAFFDIPVKGGGQTDFEYAMSSMYNFTPNLALGLELHGEVPQVFGGAPNVNSQEHFAGPAVDYQFEVDGSKVGAHLGAFYGLTDVSPDFGIAANLSFGF